MRVLNDALGKLHQPGKIVLGYDDEQSLYLIGSLENEGETKT